MILDTKRNQVRRYACLIFFSSIGYNLYALKICEAYLVNGEKFM